jgi:hypothetical protein
LLITDAFTVSFLAFEVLQLALVPGDLAVQLAGGTDHNAEGSPR